MTDYEHIGGLNADRAKFCWFKLKVPFPSDREDSGLLRLDEERRGVKLPTNVFTADRVDLLISNSYIFDFSRDPFPFPRKARRKRRCPLLSRAAQLIRGDDVYAERRQSARTSIPRDFHSRL